jgi:2-polyprenyl-3-methyl-5-hydroxy-6-metoxy-1,4-benzoquinol methylase
MAEGRQAPVTCPLCRGADHDVISTRGRDGHALTTVLCCHCGHVFNAPIPSLADLRTYYHRAYRLAYKGAVRPRPKHVLRAGRRALERLDQLRRHATAPLRLLDVGAGGGEFVYLAGKAGFDARGVEPHQGYAEQARVALGAGVVHAAVQDAEFPDESFDVITLHHVLEHLPDPVDALSRIWRWLAPGGLLMIEVPDVLSRYHAPARRFHEAHIHSFNRAGLEDLIRNGGFMVATITHAPVTGHIGLVARKNALTAATWRNVASEVRDGLHKHSPLAHVLSGQPLKRLWANLKRPAVEGAALLRLPTNDPRAMLDRMWVEAHR